MGVWMSVAVRTMPSEERGGGAMAEHEDLQIPTVYVGLRETGEGTAMPPTAEQLYRDLKAAAEAASALEATDVDEDHASLLVGIRNTVNHAARVLAASYARGIAGNTF